jgi:hypothetical protein
MPTEPHLLLAEIADLKMRVRKLSRENVWLRRLLAKTLLAAHELKHTYANSQKLERSLHLLNRNVMSSGQISVGLPTLLKPLVTTHHGQRHKL